ncbi:hypothetical protein EES42_14695 [Streptomyces sp. ADI95-17]|nr:hypothetical protein EES42_14695 [Streptomyces sp. ADI95-17]
MRGEVPGGVGRHPGARRGAVDQQPVRHRVRVGDAGQRELLRQVRDRLHVLRERVPGERGQLVHHRTADVAERRPLAARDREHPAPALRHDRFALGLGGVAGAARQHPQTGEGVRDQIARELLVPDGERRLVEDLRGVLLVDRDVRGIALVRLVRRAEQQHVLPRQGERDAVLVDRGGQRGLPRTGALQDEVRALGQAYGRRRVRVLHPAQVVDPRSGGVQHETGVDAELRAVQAVLQVGAGHPALGEPQPGHRRVVEDDRTRVDGRAHRHQRHPGVVHLVVAVDRDGLQVVRTQFGHIALRLRRADDVPDAVTERGERRVGEHPRAELGRAVRAALVDRQVEGERIGQVGGHLAGHRTPLEVVLRHQLHRAGLQVAQSAVEQLGGGGGGGAGEVAGVHQGHPQPGLRGVPGGGDAQDAATDHQEVVRSLGQLLPSLGAAREGAGGRVRPEGRDALQGGHVDYSSAVSSSSQPMARSTALSQLLYSRSRVSASMWGVHSAARRQLARSASVSGQKPTARPAA